MSNAPFLSRAPAAVPAITLVICLLGTTTGCRVEEHERGRPAATPDEPQADGFLGLRTAIYSVPDLDRAKIWYSELLSEAPYFDQPYYVGFDVSGYELGLQPDSARGSSVHETVTAYWGVAEIEREYARLQLLGATAHSPITDVGAGIRVATLLDPFGNILGLIENPNFEAR